jgi:hypothetical protein
MTQIDADQAGIEKYKNISSSFPYLRHLRNLRMKSLLFVGCPGA